MSDRAEQAGGRSRPDVSTRSETATLAFAAAAAVALGVACGIWINSLMASAASASRIAPARLAPAVAAEPRPLEPAADGPPPAATEPLHNSVEAAAGEPAATAIEGREAGRAVGERDAATHAAREAGPRAKADARRGVARDVERRATAVREHGRASPCALYASADSLSLRGGGAAPLVVGGPGEAGRVNVTTPDWANIVVLSEGRTGNGWARYTVRSVSNRPGVYAVRFNTPCGSKTISVTVTRP